MEGPRPDPTENDIGRSAIGAAARETPNVLSRQFIISSSPTEYPQGWQARRLGSLFIRHSPDLPYIRLRTPSGEGAVLGWPIFQGKLRGDGESIACSADDAVNAFPSISGRFLVLHERETGWVCLPDPCGLLPVVFSEALHMAAATPTLIPGAWGHQHGGNGDARFGEFWYPFGSTSKPDVRRLPPNHELDLGSFSCRRFWPETYLPASPTASDQTLEAIAAILKENVEALASNPRVMANLTAGRDTRIVLAALRAYRHAITFSTFAFPGQAGAHDCAVAAEIVRKLSLSHVEFLPVPPAADDVAEWLENTGHCVVGQSMTLATTAKRICTAADYNITGLAGEVGRCGYWNAEDLLAAEITADELLSRIRAPAPESFAAAARAWLEGLPSGPVHWILDLLAMEQRIGAFSAPTFYGNCQGAISMTPFNDRRLIELMLSLPPDYRFEQKLAEDLLARMWPELNEFPFNL